MVSSGRAPSALSREPICSERAVTARYSAIPTNQPNADIKPLKHSLGPFLDWLDTCSKIENNSKKSLVGSGHNPPSINHKAHQTDKPP